MWFWDFSPSARGRAKPITKKELQKIQESFVHADEIARLSREKEEIEKQKADKELEELLWEM
jgi:hypothetical protein